MDMSMILGLTLAGSIMLLSGNKNPKKEKSSQASSKSEFVISVGGDGAISVSPQKKSPKD